MKELINEGLLPKEDPVLKGVVPYSELDQATQAVMDTSAFRRLFEVRHGGLVPAKAGYSRGIHSVMAALVASRLWNDEMRFDRRDLEIAAILHDVGHAAFSHSAEDSFKEIDHKDRGIEIILNDEELQKVFREHGVEPSLIAQLALEKPEWNPFSRKREEGVISVDHFANAFGDLQFRTKRNFSPEFVRLLLDNAYIHENGRLSYSAEDVKLARALTRINIAQNVEAVFSLKGVLVDALTINLFREMNRRGILEISDFLNGEKALLDRMRGESLPEEMRGIVTMLERTIVDLDEEDLSQIVRKVSDHANGGMGKVRFDRPEHAVPRKGLYLLAPAIDGVPGQEVDSEIAEMMEAAKRRLSGVYTIDLEDVFRANRDS